ncbi:hypothetical protein ACQPZJ_35170 [Actinoplanes sp. CA-054009]
MSIQDDQLRRAFALLLGRPLEEYDPAATYAVFHHDDETAGDVLDDIEPGRLVTPVIGRSGDTGGDWLGLERWIPDYAGSLFVLDQAGAVVEGRDLPPLLPGATRVENYRRYPRLLLRPRTDGTLFDAMRAATWTMSAPDGLTDIESALRAQGYPQPGEPVTDPRWTPILTEIPDGTLRSHFQGLCLDGRWSRMAGAYYLGPGECPADLKPVTTLPHVSVIAGWEFGEGQAATVVVAL